MSLLAIAIVSISALMHAGWNLLSKSRHPSAAFFLVASFSGCLLLSPAAIWNWQFVLHGIPPQVWLLLCITGGFQAFYFASLAAAYRSGDMSVAYPLSRASPVLVVAAITLLLGRGEQVSNLCIAGIVLVVGGCFLVPLRMFRDFHLRNYWSPTCGMALLAAIGTTGYSILDDEALRQLRAENHVAISNTQLTLAYAFLEGVAATSWLLIFCAARREGRKRLSDVIQNHTWHAVAAGAAIYLTYAMVLVSLAFVQNVSYVVGFRQLSIPLGATLGMLVLGEPHFAPKLVGIAIMFLGLVMVALG